MRAGEQNMHSVGHRSYVYCVVMYVINVFHTVRWCFPEIKSDLCFSC